VNGFSQLEAHQLALSDRDGECSFYRAKDGTASSLVPEAPGRESRYVRTLTARVTTLDAFVADEKVDLSRLALLKIDVEGEEPRTVAGALDTLRAARYPAIWCEVRGPRGSTRAPNTFEPVCELLAQLGYKPWLWANGARRPVCGNEILKRADVLFER
jgi:FkbM family methyltransferase